MFNSKIMVVSLFMVGTIACAAGCRPGYTSGGPQPKSDIQCVFAMDISPSTLSQREEQLDAFDLVGLKCIAEKATLSVWMYSDRPVLIFHGVPSEEVLEALKTKFLTASATAKGKGITRPGALFKAIADEPSLPATGPMVLLVSTDGDDDDANDPFASSAAALAQRPNFKLVALGVDPNNRLAWEKAFAGASQVTIANPIEAPSAVVDALRTKKGH